MRPHPEAIVLTNGRFASLISDAGGGGSTFGALALTRWVPDATVDAYGQWLFIRDLDSGAYWSASAQPVPCSSARHEVRFRPGVAELSAVRGDVEVRMAVCVAPDDDVELRRIAVVNNGASAKRLELTTYAELALNTPAGDMGHPAFSKLFVQTRYDATRQALVAWRRLRSPDDEPLVVAQALMAQKGASAPSYETDRMRFIGRGRTLASPRAMDVDGALSGAVGNVLDPVFALRRTVELAPGERVQLLLVSAAAHDESVLDVIARHANVDAADAAFAAAGARASSALKESGLGERWGRVPRAIGAIAYGASPSNAKGIPSLVDAVRTYTMIAPLLDSTQPTRSTSVTTEPPRDSRQAHDARRSVDKPEWPNEALRGFNGYGGFNATGDEYIIHVERVGASLRLPPLPWSNVVANESVGFIASETGAGYTWSVNSRENRLTPWSNDPVCDPHAEAVWIRDEETGEFWSPTPGPSPDDEPYEVRHGLGYTKWSHESHDLEQDTCVFVPREDPVKIARLRLTNRSARRRRVSVYSYAHWVLGGMPHETACLVTTRIEQDVSAIFARNDARGEFSGRTAFASLTAFTGSETTFTSDRSAFLGLNGRVSAPATLASGAALDGTVGRQLDPCAAFRASFDIAPGGTVECVVLLGESGDDTAARDVVRRYREPGAAARAFDEIRTFWRDLVSGVQIETPAPELDLMVNGWLVYQNLSCRMWGRSAYYQSGGAFGFRDQLQDSAALVYLDPWITRRQILLHAAHQFVEGDVLHWWHPPLSKGIRTRFSDDLLWLPYITTFYVRTTGDDAVFDERVRYLRARQLEPGEDEGFLIPNDAGEIGTVYEHCCRAIERSLTRGAHGLPLMGVGDWNDGMNRVGREGRGESVWLGFFLHDILRAFVPVCEERGDTERAKRFVAYQKQLRRALNATDGGWDGEWYRRAYYDNGAPLGSKLNDECKIDAIAQAWSVLSAAAPAERAHQALDAMEQHLVSEREGIIRLLTPAFDKTRNDPGYIKGYLPGVRENGGQYTHGALWAVRALAEAGREERAARLLAMLSPVSHGGSSESISTYMAEPYVIAADVYGVQPHVGRAGWTWYTGSAGWMYRVAVESILGFELEGGDVIRLRPCIPAEWPGFTLRYRRPGSVTMYELRVRRGPVGRGTTFGGADARHARLGEGCVLVDLADDGERHVIEIALGADVGRLYVGPDDV